MTNIIQDRVEAAMNKIEKQDQDNRENGDKTGGSEK
jgi:hypothetical protein